jgi:VCBS repeat protein/FG-GAP repeat protein
LATRYSYRKDRVYNPGLEYAPDMVNFSYDFNGDGWPDILASGLEGSRPIDLYLNPKGESRLWDHFRVLPNISSELVLMKDIFGDGKPAILFRAGNIYAWARPDPENPMTLWTQHRISEPSTGGNNHGMGVGDINGDGRRDFIVPNGWYEQPPKGTEGQWTFHPASFGPGGGEIGVYDINGDGLADVITTLAAHEWGLSWFEQKKDAGGSITWVEHPVMGDYAAKNAGGVAFSQLHAAAIADMDGDGIPDFVTGKRYWSHLENYNDPDPYGPAVVYVYRTVRNPKAPGGAEFVPELIHNHSGVGSTVAIGDLNKDGKPDVATAGALGTFVFLSKPGTWGRATPGGPGR